MTDFLKELELQMTAAAHHAVAERSRPPRVRRWPALAFVAASSVAVAGMFLLPDIREAAKAPASKPAVALAGTTVAIYNAAGTDGLASSAKPAIERLGARPLVDTLPGVMRYSVVQFDTAHAPEARRIAQALGIERLQAPGKPHAMPDGRPVDVSVVLGEDFAVPAPQLLASFAFLRESLNRWVDTPAGRVRVIAARTGLCLQIRDGSGWFGPCFDVDDALAGKAVGSLRARDGRLRGAFGLVPDGVDAVELGQTDETRRLPVGRNLWAVGAEQVNTVTFDGVTVTVP